LNNVAKVLTKADFKPATECLTHLLFLKRWESNFNHKTVIEKEGKNFIEKKVKDQPEKL
jgi:hypothetical protein